MEQQAKFENPSFLVSNDLKILSISQVIATKESAPFFKIKSRVSNNFLNHKISSNSKLETVSKARSKSIESRHVKRINSAFIQKAPNIASAFDNKLLKHSESNSTNENLIFLRKNLFPFLKKNLTTFSSPDSNSQICFKDVFSGRPKFICFGENTSNSEVVFETEKTKFSKFKYRALDSFEVLHNLFLERNFKQSKSKNWLLIWGFINFDTLDELSPFQKVNHFPGCWNLGRKDNLYRFNMKMQRMFPKEFDFIPQTFLLQNDESRFKNQRATGLWILKPCASSRGRGVKMIKSNTPLPQKNKSNYLVSKYIENPLLINKFKYDLRVYVLVTSFEPLIVYVYNEGLVRFATSPYSKKKKNLKNIFAHVTNYSINKNAPNFAANDDENGGFKWSFLKLKEKYKEQGINFDKIFDQIKDIAVKTMISVESLMLIPKNRETTHRKNCFELYGFDILVDSNLKVWLLEVNVSPSLQAKTEIDRKIKFPLIQDILNTVGIEAFERKVKTMNKEKNSHHLSDLENLLEKSSEILKMRDWDSIIQLEEEFIRKGNFERAFPNSENIDFYEKFFQNKSWCNSLLWNYLKSNKGLINTLIEQLNK